MRKTYRYGYRPHKRRHIVAVVVSVVLLVFGPASFFIYQDVKKNGSGNAEGTSRVVAQVVGDVSNKKLDINEPYFAMKLPIDWVEGKRQPGPNGGYTVYWNATKKNESNKWITVYVDVVPDKLAVNRLLPVFVEGGGLSTGDVSENCSTFTGAADKTAPKDTLARWQGVDFICNLSSVVENQVGVGVVGGSVNQVVIKGQQFGAHKYFFLFTDHNIQPDYNIFIDALQSFRAK